MKKMKKSKGFTLAELLIVVAIMAVLVGVAIPVFSTQLNKAKVSADLANVRSWYAEVTAKYFDDLGGTTAWTDPTEYNTVVTGYPALTANNASVNVSGSVANSTFKAVYSADGTNNVTIGKS